MKGAAAVSFFPKKDTSQSLGIRLPKSILERVTEIAEREHINRNQVVTHLIRVGLEQYDLAAADRKKK